MQAGWIETDAVVIGAGPVGLFQVFQLGLQEIRAHVIDALPYPGGQCAELYADKPIYDIPGIPVCTGQELTHRLLEQIAPFGATMHLGQQVAQLSRTANGLWAVKTDKGTALLAKTVFIAAGVGAFVPRQVPVQGLERFIDSQVFYRPISADSARGKRVVVMGGEASAVDTALELAESGLCHSVQLLHRTDKFKHDAEPTQRLQDCLDSGRIDVVVGQPLACVTAEDDDSRLMGLEIATLSGSNAKLPLDVFLPRLGLTPQLGPVADWGLLLERKQLVVDPATFSTNLPGVFAVGDVCTYPGKRKLILCGFHEATLAAFAAAEIVHPDRRILLQYTTTSTRLHELLGLSPSSSKR